MPQYFSDPSRETETYALPDVEVFHATAGELWDGTDDRGDEPNDEGWYYWTCLPGCMPDSDPFGPFRSEEEAVADMRATFLG